MSDKEKKFLFIKIKKNNLHANMEKEKKSKIEKQR